jgi:aspartyl-tRNA(Asn)/glutamyl-tRNA(Gln) amidotransferase subunit A
VSETEIAYLSALELIERYRARTLSPVEVTETILRRIERLNPRLTAFITVTPELAMEQAKAAEAAYGNGTAGPLAGVPISIKDLTITKGIRTTRGSLLSKDYVPDEDPPFVERVYAAGAVMLGKTNTPEFGWKGDSGNRLVGPTHNPWKHGRTAGGSSGGAGAAIASGLGPLAQGSDGGGSIRIPASFNGIVGFKPSAGLVPMYPASLYGDLAHWGPMARTVRDAALLLDVTNGADPRDRLSWTSGLSYLPNIEGGVKGLKIAWSPFFNDAEPEPAVLDRTTKAVERFKALGATVEELPGLSSDANDTWNKLWWAGCAATHIDNFEEVKDLIDPGRIPLIELGRKLSGAEVAVLQTRRNRFYAKLSEYMRGFDLLITPSLARTAFKAGDDVADTLNGKPLKQSTDWSPYAHPFNLTGHPAISLPAGFDDEGLPIGLQIVGNFHDDTTVLRAAAAFEAIAPLAHLRPPVDQ